MSKICLVTGGSGFIGTHLLETLLSDGRYDRIHNVDIRAPRVEDERLVHHSADIRAPFELQISAPVDVCFHLAALSKEPGHGWDDYFLTNHLGTRHLLEVCGRLGVTNVVFPSTMMVYRAGDKRMCEESITAPDTAYGISKILAEAAVEIWGGEDPRRRYRIVRPAVVFGKHENGNFTRLHQTLKKGFFFYIGRNSTVKSNIYVKDVVRFLLFLADDNGERNIYNMAFNETHSIRTICETFFDVFGYRRRIFTMPYSIALLAGYFFEGLNALGLLKSGIHHRRIQKLYHSTFIAADAMLESGFKLNYTLEEALADWQKECQPEDIY